MKLLVNLHETKPEAYVFLCVHVSKQRKRGMKLRSQYSGYSLISSKLWIKAIVAMLYNMVYLPPTPRHKERYFFNYKRLGNNDEMINGERLKFPVCNLSTQNCNLHTQK